MSSELLKIGFVAEGPTDYAMLRAVVRSIIAGYDPSLDFTITSLQPELDEYQRARIGGWGGVYRWCREIVGQFGSATQDPQLADFSLIVIQLDADVAEFTYAGAHISDGLFDNLPCTWPCPPPSDTTNALRQVLLGWLEEPSVPRNVVFCIPSKALETWAIVGLYPQDEDWNRFGENFECHPYPDRILLSKPRQGRLISGGKKDLPMYQKRARELADRWLQVCDICTEALHFTQSVNDLLARLSTR